MGNVFFIDATKSLYYSLLYLVVVTV